MINGYVNEVVWYCNLVLVCDKWWLIVCIDVFWFVIFFIMSNDCVMD